MCPSGIFRISEQEFSSQPRGLCQYNHEESSIRTDQENVLIFPFNGVCKRHCKNYVVVQVQTGLQHLFVESIVRYSAVVVELSTVGRTGSNLGILHLNFLVLYSSGPSKVGPTEGPAD